MGSGTEDEAMGSGTEEGRRVSSWGSSLLLPLCAVPSAAGVTAHIAHVDSRANAAQSFQFTRIDEDALATRPNRVASPEPPQLSAAAVLLLQ